MTAVCLRGCSPLGDRVSVNSQSGEGRRHDLSLSIPESCVDEVFTHSRVFSQKGKKIKKKERGLRYFYLKPGVAKGPMT